MLVIRKKSFAVLTGAALCAFAIAATTATAASAAVWVPPSWAASSTSTVFSSSVITITCTKDTAGGSSIGQAPDDGALAMNAPTFKTCTDSLGGTDTVTSAKKGWTVSFIADSTNSACPSGTGGGSGTDCVVLGVPQDAATIKVGGAGNCVLTVQPNGPTSVGATVSDPGGKTKDTFTISNVPLSFTGCGTSGTADFSGTYTLSAPNGGVLVDTHTNPDQWVPPAWAASSTSTVFSSSVITITCTKDAASGSSIGQTPDVGPLAMNAPTFSTCSDSLGGTDKVTSAKSGWTVAFYADDSNSACPSGTGGGSGTDCVVLGVPQNAAKITVGGAGGCVLTVQPNGPTSVGATVSDPGGKTKDTFTISNVPLSFTGCGTSGTANFSGTYTLSAPNGGVLVSQG